jgi:hypothetical protein
MPELMWWIILIYISIRLLRWLWRHAPPTLLRSGARRQADIHDAAISVAAVLGVRDGLHVDGRATEDDGPPVITRSK